MHVELRTLVTLAYCSAQFSGTLRPRGRLGQQQLHVSEAQPWLCGSSAKWAALEIFPSSPKNISFKSRQPWKYFLPSGQALQ
jgi:hypothetical protein